MPSFGLVPLSVEASWLAAAAVVEEASWLLTGVEGIKVELEATEVV